ncbi:MAG: hypothetical protein JWN94_2446 [Betaproteobacteria bacterium]|nr:hypothetical protein [Betaproteobacteria bacterium]
MKWFKRFAILTAVLAAIAAAIPLFIKLDDFIPRVEKEASAKLSEPVTIKRLSFGLMPVPHLTVDGIAIGKTADIRLAQVTVKPAILSLLSATKVIRSVEVKSLVLTQKAIDKLTALGKSSKEAPAPVRIESIRLDDALIQFENTQFGPFDARISLDSSGQPADSTVTTQDGKLKISVKPDNAQYLIDAVAKAWKAPLGPPIEFDELLIKGVATVNGAEFNDISAKLYGGTVKGKASAGWLKGLQVKGSFEIDQIELKTLVPLVSPGAKMSGRLNAKPVFSASAADANQLLNAMHLETPFNVQNGVLHGIDIEKAATHLIKQGATGGETRFEQLSGHLVRDRAAHQFTQLKIASGALAADGNVNISARQDLSGRVNAQVKAVGTSATVPLNVAGTVHSPLLYPSGGTMAGAAIGTVLLPGVGTGIGAKAGQAIEGLFGKKK